MRDGINVLGQQPVPVPAGQHDIEQPSRFVPPADRSQRVDVPESAREKGVLRLPEVIFDHVPIDEVAAAQVSSDRFDGGDEARIISRDETHVVHPQQ